MIDRVVWLERDLTRVRLGRDLFDRGGVADVVRPMRRMRRLMTAVAQERDGGGDCERGSNLPCTHCGSLCPSWRSGRDFPRLSIGRMGIQLERAVADGQLRDPSIGSWHWVL